MEQCADEYVFSSTVNVLLNLTPMILVSTLSLLIHIFSNKNRISSISSLSSLSSSAIVSTNNDDAGLSRQVAMLLCCCVAHATYNLTIQQRQPRWQTTMMTQQQDPQQQQSADKYDGSEEESDPSNHEHDLQRAVYLEHLVVACAYLPIFFAVLETLLRPKLRTSHRRPSSDDRKVVWKSSEQRRKRWSFRWIGAGVQPLAPASLSLLFLTVFSFAISLDKINSALLRPQRDDDDDNDDGGVSVGVDVGVGADDIHDDGNPRSETTARWWTPTEPSVLSPQTDDEIPPLLLLWFLLSYTIVLLASRTRTYRAELSHLFPHLFRSDEQRRDVIGYGRDRGASFRNGRHAVDEGSWYRWTAGQFLTWIREWQTDGAAGEEDRGTHRHTRKYNDSHRTDNSDSDGEEDNQSRRIHDLLTPHRIHGALLPHLAVPDWRAMGLVYGDAVALHVRIVELRCRWPAPPEVFGGGEVRGSDGVKLGEEEEKRGIDLEGWLRDGEKSIGECRQSLAVIEEGDDGEDGMGGGVDGVRMGMETAGMERAEEIMSKRFGLHLPQLRTTTAVDERGTTPHPLPPPFSTATTPPIHQNPPLHAITDAMPANIREIASRRPDLMQTLLQNPPPPISSANATPAVPRSVVDAMPAGIREIASRRPDLVRSLLLQQQRPGAQPKVPRPKEQLRPHLRLPVKSGGGGESLLSAAATSMTVGGRGGDGAAVTVEGGRSVSFSPFSSSSFFRSKKEKDDGDGLGGLDVGLEVGVDCDLVHPCDDGDETVGLLRKRRVGGGGGASGVHDNDLLSL